MPYIIRKTIFVLDSTLPSEKGWVQSPDLPLGESAGYQARIHFVFDTINNIDNNYRGIAIDDVELVGTHWSDWAEMSGEVILNWQGGLPKHFIYRGTKPDFMNDLPELRAYTPFRHKYENSLNDEESYYYIVK